MFLAVLTTLMGSFSETFWKRSLIFNVNSRIHELSAYPIPFILLGILLFMGVSFDSVDPIIIIGIIGIVLLDTLRMNTQQQVYKEEKFSIIAPYTNINKILIIVGSFFIFNDVSVTSLGITILAIIVIMGFSIDLKSHKLPRNVKKLFFIETLKAIGGLLSGYLIINYSENVFFILYVLTTSIIVGGIVCYMGYLPQIKTLPKKFWIYRYMGGVGWISWFLGLILISNLGLSVSVLLSFLGIGASFIFAYIFAKDVPSKKNILLTLIVTILVGLGFYFK